MTRGRKKDLNGIQPMEWVWQEGKSKKRSRGWGPKKGEKGRGKKGKKKGPFRRKQRPQIKHGVEERDLPPLDGGGRRKPVRKGGGGVNYHQDLPKHLKGTKNKASHRKYDGKGGINGSGKGVRGWSPGFVPVGTFGSGKGLSKGVKYHYSPVPTKWERKVCGE